MKILDDVRCPIPPDCNLPEPPYLVEFTLEELGTLNHVCYFKDQVARALTNLNDKERDVARRAMDNIQNALVTAGFDYNMFAGAPMYPRVTR